VYLLFNVEPPEVSSVNPEIPNNINEDTLLRSIWLKPTATLQYILAYCPDKYVSVLLVLGGIARAADRASRQNSGDKMSTATILMMVIIVGGLTGWITYYVYGWALSAIGRWLGGRADAESFRTVLAWALVPTGVILALLLLQAVVFGDDLFRSEPKETSFIAENLRLFFVLVEAVLSIWTLVIFVQGVRLLQSFSVSRALANIVLPGAIVIGAIFLAAGIFKLL
jgi:hypothetical protein